MVCWKANQCCSGWEQLGIPSSERHQPSCLSAIPCNLQHLITLLGPVKNKLFWEGCVTQNDWILKQQHDTLKCQCIVWYNKREIFQRQNQLHHIYLTNIKKNLTYQKSISFPLPQKVDTNTFHTPHCVLGCWGTARPPGDCSIWSNSGCSTPAPLRPKWKGMVIQKYEGDDSRAKTKLLQWRGLIGWTGGEEAILNVQHSQNCKIRR